MDIQSDLGTHTAVQSSMLVVSIKCVATCKWGNLLSYCECGLAGGERGLMMNKTSIQRKGAP